MILTCEEMKALEQRTFNSGATAEILMEEAGEKIARAVRQFTRCAGYALVFFGKGHNGGDALVAARHLAVSGWDVRLRAIFPQKKLSPLTRDKLRGAINAGTAQAHEINVPDGF